ncbi:MAG: hypothetical protein K2K75_13060 [Muribaculaceae bacterium]|nr:hypothetical protein [Muribaculaceae bacterium]
MSKYTDITIGLRHRIKEFFYGLKYLSIKNDIDSIDANERNSIISMVDGRMWHGGITDRFKGIISGALFAQYLNRPFRIKYTYPFQLTDYLVPNEYDWTIDDKNMSNSIFNSRALCTRHEKGKRMLKVNYDGQIRFYCNVDLTTKLDFAPFNQDWGKVFNSLFKPSPTLQKELDRHAMMIGGEYVAMAFRFQNLLGDFKEYHYKQINNPEYKERLIQANLDEIKNLLASGSFRQKYKKILVTSDSGLFLERAQQIPNVYALSGKTAHVDTRNTGNTNHIKAFVDFFMISKASKVYSVSIDGMFESDFPKYAAKLMGVPFFRITRDL